MPFMRFVVSIERVLFVILFVAVVPAYADTDDCASPPGPQGTIRCESDQIAICEATGSRVNGQCLDKRGRKGEDLAARILSVVLNRQITADEVQREEFQRVLREKRIAHPDGTVVTFSYNDESASYQRDSDTTPPPRPGTPAEDGTSFTCTACVTARNRKMCEEGTGSNKQGAAKAAAEKLHQRLIAAFGPTLDSEFEHPSIECK
jgi:hypothetical protein